MTGDPNWFYSSLAQAAAAIVGLVGGFIVAALLRQREQIAGRREDLVRNAKAIKRAIEIHGPAASEVVAWIDQQLVAMPAIGTAKQISRIPQLTGGFMDNPEAWVVSQDDAAQLRELRRHAQAFAGSYVQVDAVLGEPKRNRERRLRDLEGVIAAEKAIQQAWQGRADALTRMLSNTPQALDGYLLVQLRSYYRDLAVAENEAIPLSFLASIALLVFLSIVGVLFPLTRLSAQSEADRSLLVVLFGLGLLGLVAFIGAQLWQTRRLVRVRSADWELS